MIVGFTGTRSSVTDEQSLALEGVLTTCYAIGVGDMMFHHGDCRGADAEGAASAKGLGFVVYSHPPLNDTYRAFTPASDFQYEPAEYIERNHRIVDLSDVLIALPKRNVEELRSGTWATVRYARKQGKPVIVVWPDGRVTAEKRTSR